MICGPIFSERNVVHTVKKPTKEDKASTDTPLERVQHDEPWWSHADVMGDVCAKSLPDDAITCSEKRKRWHYNALTGKCERFLGCPTHGNNFARKRYCKEQCRYRYMNPSEIKAASIEEDKVCFEPLPSSASTCGNKTKRWHYNAQTGKCEKFHGCASHGNNFSKKVACKAKCLRKKTYTNFLKGKMT